MGLSDAILSSARFWSTEHSRAFRNIATIRDQVLAEYELSSAEWFVIEIVSRYPEDGIQVGDIARTINVQTTYIAMLLRQLQEKKLVNVTLSTQDRRVHLVTLTDSGVEKLNQTEQSLSKAFSAWTEAMSAADKRGFDRAAHVLAQMISPADK